MSTLILILGAIAVFHFAYESILAPAFRMMLRNELFVLRDRLRRMKIEQQVEDAEFACLHESINFLLPRLNQISISLTHEIIRAINSDAELKKRIKERREVVEQSQNRDVLSIYAGVFRVFERTLVCNSGVWFIYVIPIALAWRFFSKSAGLLKDALTLPSAAAERLSPLQLPPIPAEV